MIKLLLILLTCLNSIKTLQENNFGYKCNHDGFKNQIKYATNIIKNENPNKIFALNSDGFKTFNIYLDLYNLDYEATKYNIQSKKDFFIKGLTRAKTTLEKLLKVKQVKNFVFTDAQLKAINITKWDKAIIGDEAIKQNKGMVDLGIDLYLFVFFKDKKEMGETVLASAGAAYLDRENKQPLIGIVNINREVDYSKTNSMRYLEGILVHELTHVLGFSSAYFVNYKNICYIDDDAKGIQKYYLNSTRLLDTAKKYFNCNSLKGIPLEEYGGQGTAGSHWDARVLLGDYMNGVIYPEEQVISEFTLAVLEDLGYYQANYYTGGLLKFGKNKGCDFLNKNCIINGNINEQFSNEFFDVVLNEDTFSDAGCSSGRQSRTYHYLLRFKENIPVNYRYFDDPKLGGYPPADYCPINMEDRGEESSSIYYVGHCSEIGSGNYGSQISYTSASGKFYYKNSELQSFTGEAYSNTSFCALSSLITKNANNYQLLSKTVRGICYQMYCSDRSLTIKIHNNYIVCPRAGGKISVPNYEGYLLCPDYYLICSSTVLCNDMFDCLDKNSTLKSNIKYDYTIKTSQDISLSETEDFSEDNYELSNNGICPQNCIHCSLKDCLYCRKSFGLLQLNESSVIKKVCKSYKELEHGYYKDENDIYHKCLDNCDKCENGEKCIKCKSNYKLVNNSEVCEKTYTNYIIIAVVVVAVILLIVIGIIIFRRIRKGRISSDPNKISFHKDANENLLYSAN